MGGSKVSGLSGLGVLPGQVGVDVFLAEAVGLTDSHRSQLAGLDQAIHRHRRHPQLIGNLENRKEPSARLALRHGKPLPPLWALYAPVAGVVRGELVPSSRGRAPWTVRS